MPDSTAALVAWLRSLIATGDGWSIQIEAADLPALAEILDRAERLPRRPRKTRCINEHEMTGDNVYYQPSTGANRCRACWRQRAQRAYRKRKERTENIP